MAEVDCTVLLSNGHRIPIVGIETALFQYDTEAMIRIGLEAAIDAGYRHIDTASTYLSEKFVGNILSSLIQENKIKREDIFITSKLPCNGMQPDAVEYFLRLSLADLQLNFVDLYLVHNPLSSVRTDNPKETIVLKDGDCVVEEVDLVKTWQAMESIVDKGLAKSIGLSNFNSQQIQRIYDAARIKPVNVQVECHAYLPQYELLEFCQKLNISFTAYAPLGSSSFPTFAKEVLKVNVTGKKLLEDEALKPLSDKHNRTPAQILLRYLIQRGIIVIPKSNNPERIKQNIQIFDFTLDDEDMAALKSMANGCRYFTLDYWESFRNHPEFPFNIPY